MLQCKKAALLLSQNLDGELGALRTLQLQCHQLICNVCRRLKEQLSLQKHAASLVDNEEISVPSQVEGSTLPETARQRIKSLMKK